MQIFLAILTNLRAAIAAKAARDRALTVMLCLVWARVARMGQRMERLFMRWKAGTLPKPRPSPIRHDRATAKPPGARPVFPSAPGWLFSRVWEAGACGTQLAHLVQDPEFAAFIAEVPQAARILRPLFRMLMADPAPDIVRPRRAVAFPPLVSATLPASVGVLPAAQFLDA